MPNPVSLTDARAQCSLDPEDTSQDLLLGAYIAAAKAAAQGRTRISLADTGRQPTEDDLAIIRAAMLMMIAHWFNNREAAVVDNRGTPAEVPMSATWLLNSIKIWTV